MGSQVWWRKRSLEKTTSSRGEQWAQSRGCGPKTRTVTNSPCDAGPVPSLRKFIWAPKNLHVLKCSKMKMRKGTRMGRRKKGLVQTGWSTEPSHPSLWPVPCDQDTNVCPHAQTGCAHWILVQMLFLLRRMFSPLSSAWKIYNLFFSSQVMSPPPQSLPWLLSHFHPLSNTSSHTSEFLQYCIYPQDSICHIVFLL